uniref:Uncharacterized protein n=1 Tax=Oryzias melastigma TaxID=30732 RepID=A0A3B3BW22_ORYME
LSFIPSGPCVLCWMWACKGTQGPHGAPGSKGSPGPDGAPGSKGSHGPHGAPGSKGSQGPHGAPGSKGSQGPDGAPSWEGSPGPDGAPDVEAEPGSLKVSPRRVAHVWGCLWGLNPTKNLPGPFFFAKIQYRPIRNEWEPRISRQGSVTRVLKFSKLFSHVKSGDIIKIENGEYVVITGRIGERLMGLMSRKELKHFLKKERGYPLVAKAANNTLVECLKSDA